MRGVRRPLPLLANPSRSCYRLSVDRPPDEIGWEQEVKALASFTGEQIVELLSRIPFLEGLNRKDLEALAREAVVAQYRKNQVLFVEGQPSHSFYFICRGRVKVYRVSPDGREQILHLLRDGEPIALVPFFDGGPYPANAEVLVDSTIAFMRFEDFRRVCEAHPSILFHTLRAVARRLRRAQEEIASLALKDAGQRLAARLLELADRHGQREGDGIAIDLNLSRQELGNMIGVSRETATRLLHQFQREKIIEIDGSRITIRKPLILQTWSQP